MGCALAKAILSLFDLRPANFKPLALHTGDLRLEMLFGVRPSGISYFCWDISKSGIKYLGISDL